MTEKMQLLHYHTVCPSVSRFANCVVRIYPKDHAPPHFHVVMNDDREVWVKIDTVEIIYGKVPSREIAEVLDWANSRRAFLSAKFEELQQ